VIDTFEDMRIIATHCVVHGVLEANTAIAVTRHVQASQDLEFDAVSPSGFCNDIEFEAVKQPLEDRPDNSKQRRDLVGYRTLLLLNTNLHDVTVANQRELTRER
jgi:hypothetical protein